MKKAGVNVFFSIMLAVILSSCASVPQGSTENSASTKDSNGATIQKEAEPRSGVWGWIYKTFCLEVWESDYVIPDYPPGYEPAQQDEEGYQDEEEYEQ